MIFPAGPHCKRVRKQSLPVWECLLCRPCGVAPMNEIPFHDMVKKARFAGEVRVIAVEGQRAYLVRLGDINVLIHANFLFANPSLLSAGWSYPKALVDTYVDEVVDFDPPLTDAASAWERCRCGRMNIEEGRQDLQPFFKVFGADAYVPADADEVLQFVVPGSN